MSPRLLALAAVVATGCTWDTITPDEFKKEFGFEPYQNAQREVDVFAARGLAQCLARLEAAVGERDVHATDLTIQPTFVELTARSPKDRTDLDEYECRYGKVGPSTPQQSDRTSAQLDPETFTFSQIDFAGLPAVLERALKDAALEGGKLSHAIIETEGGRPVVRVYVDGTRKDTMFTFDGHGVELERDGIRIQAAAPTAPEGVTLASLATASLPAQQFVILGQSGLEGSVTAFDPVAQLAWGRRVAAAWKPDATAYRLDIADAAATGTVDLHAGASVEMWFASPACMVSGSGGRMCGLGIVVDAPGGVVRVRLELTHGWTGTPIASTRCGLMVAIAVAERLTHRPPAELCHQISLSTVGDKPAWSFVDFQRGTTLSLDAASCAVVGAGHAVKAIR